ncbi:MAG TPA: cytochrome o ubiquinol oxidase subunit IV [Caulobacteraceae bacterium]|jgi:cytochrome o ubiquinol oxidase operon protein cyoD|nr:cytochrome o ubiquinol oxidase subunit IV [Caulobacteraceae bacterium]
MSGANSHPSARHDFGHGDLKTYGWGFGLSLLLTALSFAAIMSGMIPRGMMFPAITVLAVVQLLTQVVFFLHLGTAPEQRSTITILVLTLLLIGVIVFLSLWVMHNANVNMMPTLMTPDQAMARS